MATAKISLLSIKKLKDGSHPLYLTITIHRNRKKFNLNRSCHKKYWDDKLGLPGKEYPQKYKGGERNYKKTVLVDYLKTRLNDANNIILEYERDGKILSFTEFESKFQQKINKNELTVFNYFEAEIERLKTAGQYGYSLVYKSTLNALKIHFKNDFRFIELTPNKINCFIKTFRDRGANGQTISVYLRTFRTVIKKAIQERLLFENPIEHKIISGLDEPTSTKGLTLAELRKLYFLDLSEHPELEFPRDVFFICFHLQGMSFADLAEIRFRNIKRNEINYRRRKTGKPVKVVINSDALTYIEKYKKNTSPDDYVFPILDKDKHISEDQILNRIKKVLKQVNKGLKEIAQLAGIDPDLTSYWSRHSFALRLLHGKNNIMLIKESLGHVSLQTTQRYLKQFSEDLAEATSDLLELRTDDKIRIPIKPNSNIKSNAV